MLSKYKYYIIGAVIIVAGYYAYKKFFAKSKVSTNAIEGTEHVKPVAQAELAY